MNYNQQNAWMEQQLVGLTQEAAENGVGAYVLYGQLLAAAAGIGANLEDDLQEEVHESLEDELSAEAIQMMQEVEDAV